MDDKVFLTEDNVFLGKLRAYFTEDYVDSQMTNVGSVTVDKVSIINIDEDKCYFCVKYNNDDNVFVYNNVNKNDVKSFTKFKNIEEAINFNIVNNYEYSKFNILRTNRS